MLGFKKYLEEFRKLKDAPSPKDTQMGNPNVEKEESDAERTINKKTKKMKKEKDPSVTLDAEEVFPIDDVDGEVEIDPEDEV
jgi:hypothetical protein